MQVQYLQFMALANGFYASLIIRPDTVTFAVFPRHNLSLITVDTQPEGAVFVHTLAYTGKSREDIAAVYGTLAELFEENTAIKL
jgi:hypothetical protein